MNTGSCGDRSRYDLGCRTDVLADVADGPVSDALVVLAGPRRIGGSVALLDAAASLCGRRDVDPRQVIHLPCDGMRDRDLRRSLTLARELTRSADRHGTSPRIWLLDEVSAVQGWTAVLESARDGTDFGDDTVVATGSRWSEAEDIEGSLMAGRAGTGGGRRRRLLLPMSFRDFLAATRPELAGLERTHPAPLQDSRTAGLLAEVAFDVDGYDLAWQQYLTCGGFALAVAEHERGGDVSDAHVRDLAAWLRRDVDVDGAPESVPTLLATRAARSTSPLDLVSTADALGTGRSAVELRIRRLVSTFGAVWCVRREGDVRVAGAQAKLYLTEPLLSWLPPRLRAGLPEPDMTQLTEAAVGVSLARAVDAAEEGRWLCGDVLGYARTGSGKEVDFAPTALPSAAGVQHRVPPEMKWVDDGWRSEARTIDGNHHRGILATKSVLDTTDAVWAVPAPLLALLLQ